MPHRWRRWRRTPLQPRRRRPRGVYCCSYDCPFRISDGAGGAPSASGSTSKRRDSVRRRAVIVIAFRLSSGIRVAPSTAGRCGTRIATLCGNWSDVGERGREFVSRAELQFVEDTREVTLHRPRRDEERLGDLAVGESLAGELGDAALAGCERVEPGEHDPARARAGRAKL